MKGKSFCIGQNLLQDLLAFQSRTIPNELTTLYHKGGKLMLMTSGAKGVALKAVDTSSDNGSLGVFILSTAALQKIIGSRGKSEFTISRDDTTITFSTKRVKVQLVVINSNEPNEEAEVAKFTALLNKMDEKKWLTLGTSQLALLSNALESCSLSAYLGEDSPTFTIRKHQGLLDVAFFDNYHSAWFLSKDDELDIGEHDLILEQSLVDIVFKGGKNGLNPGFIRLGENTFDVMGGNKDFVCSFFYVQEVSTVSRISALEGLKEQFHVLFKVKIAKTALQEALSKISAVYDINATIQFEVILKEKNATLNLVSKSHYGSAKVSVPCSTMSKNKGPLTFESDFTVFEDLVNVAVPSEADKITLSVIATDPEEKVQGSLLDIECDTELGHQILFCSLAG